MKITILAGGVGTRMWPRSRAGRPKQFLDVATPQVSLLQETVQRIRPLVAMEDILVVTGGGFAAYVADQLPDLPRQNILAEPSGRGSAPAIGWAATTIQQRWGKQVMVSLHSDHHIVPAELLRQALLAAAQVAEQGRIVTLGIVPSKAHTGYGHVQRGELLSTIGDLPVYTIRRFVEKPDLDKAREYTASGDYYWNTGMFVWQTETILGEMARYMPDLARALATIGAGQGKPDERATLERVWQGLKVEQIDYGIMEHTQLGAVIAVDKLRWSDLGDWNSLQETTSPDDSGNIIVGEHEGIDTSNSIIVGSGKRLIATIGLNDMIVVETDDAILVCPRQRAQDVRKLVEQLRTKRKEHYL